MIKEALIQLAQGKDLKFESARVIFEEIFSATATTAQVAAFLTALSIKGESSGEIAAVAEVIRAHSLKVKVKQELAGIEDKSDIVFDCCGTGGGGGVKFNISTAVALVVAAAGVKVAKHGNRAMSSKSGSADCFEALGVKVEVSHRAMEEAIKQVGLGFLYAPLYHPALKGVAAIRREIGIKTIFNVAGPLSNPAGATHQLLGVYKKEFLPIIVQALKTLGTQRAMVVYSPDLKDEVSLSASTSAMMLDKGKVTSLKLSAKSFGLKQINPALLRAKSAVDSAAVIKKVLSGQVGPYRDIILANSACGLFVAGVVPGLKAGVKLAADLIDQGLARQKLTQLIKFINNYA